MFQRNTQPIPILSHLSLCFILEAFQAIMSEHGDAQVSALGVPQISQITDGSLVLYHS